MIYEVMEMKAKGLILGLKKAIPFPFFMDVYGRKT